MSIMDAEEERQTVNDDLPDDSGGTGNSVDSIGTGSADAAPSGSLVAEPVTSGDDSGDDGALESTAAKLVAAVVGDGTAEVAVTIV